MRCGLSIISLSSISSQVAKLPSTFQWERRQPPTSLGAFHVLDQWRICFESMIWLRLLIDENLRGLVFDATRDATSKIASPLN
jgi:hypothetical protein